MIVRPFTSILFLFIIISIQSCPDTCVQCQADGNSCTACSDSYQRTIQGNCIIPTISNCILFSSNNLKACYKCEPSYKLASNICVKEYTGCSKYSINNKCVQCGFGLRLNGDQCTGVLNCAKNDNDTKCVQCQSGFVFKDNKCTYSSSNCTEIDSLTGACKKCTQENNLVGFKCVADYIDPQFCYVFDQNGQCKNCKQGFTNLEGSCYSTGQIQKIYKGETVRSRRIIKVQVVNTDTTVAATNINTTNNATVINKSTDQKQSNSSSSSTNSSSSTSTNQSGSVQRCARYDNSSICLLCQTSYTLVNQTCIYAIDGCISYQLITGGKSAKCISCDSSKYDLQPNTNICLQKKTDSVKNCLIPTLDNSKCVVCNQGFVLAAGQCTVQTNVKETPQKRNCDTFDQQNKKCKSCTSTDLFKLQNGFCLDLNCLKFNSIVKNQCQACKPSYALNTTSLLCQIKDPNCLQSLNQKCLKCSSQYFLNSLSLCSPIPNGCQIPNPTTLLCSICSKDFLLLANGTCRSAPAIPNCLTPDTNINSFNKCKVCISGYYPSYEKCQKVSQRCDGYDKDTGVCTGCKDTFILTKGKCSDTNCIKQSTLTLDLCDQCRDVFKFSNGKCRFSDANCQVIKSDQCTQCLDGYIVVGVKCVVKPAVVVVDNKNTTQVNNSSNNSNNASNTTNNVINNSTTTTNNTSTNKNTTSNVNATNNVTSNTTSNNTKPVVSSNTTNNNNNNNNTTNTVNTTTNTTKPSNTTNSSNNTNNTNNTNNSTNNNNNTNTTKPVISTTIPNCLQPSSTNPNKFCLLCQALYTLSPDSTQCLPPSINDSSINKDQNCLLYDIIDNKRCTKCIDRYYLNSNGNKCLEVNQLCNDYDQNGGACITCFEGFYLDQGKCFIKTQIDQYCVQKAMNGCAKCVQGYFIDLNKNSTCQKVNSFCLNVNYTNGKCTSCAQGYSLISTGQCVNLSDDPNCVAYYTPDKKYCQKCIQTYFVNTVTGKCQQINPNCRNYNTATGQCYTCKDGYKISKGLCQKSIQIQTYIQDYYCKSKTNQVCVECFNGYYLTVNNVCKQKNPICKQVERTNGDCTQCYNGYNLVQGACVVPSNLQQNNITPSSNCKVFTTTKEACKQCYPGYRLVNNACLDINPLCKSFQNASGLCTACYDGYYLEGGNCLINLGNNPNELDPFCTQLSQDFTNCIKCAPGYFVNDSGSCVAYNTSYQCENYSPTSGKCMSCFYGYILSTSKICIQQTKHCSQYDSTNTNCVECSTGYFLKQTVCFTQDIKCEVYDAQSGNCSKCIAGYFFYQNQCIFPTFGYDRFCTKYVNSYCTQCGVGSYLFNYRCRQIDANCSKFDYSKKTCLQCGNGLKARGISCVKQN